MKTLALIFAFIISTTAYGATAFVINPDCRWSIGFDRYDVQRAANLALGDCQTQHCGGGRLVESMGGAGYGAVALGVGGRCQYGYALNEWSRQLAKQHALKRCQSAGSQHCVIAKTWYYY